MNSKTSLSPCNVPRCCFGHSQRKCMACTGQPPKFSLFFERKSGCNFPPRPQHPLSFLRVRRFITQKDVKAHDIHRVCTFVRNLHATARDQPRKLRALCLHLKGFHYVINRCPSLSQSGGREGESNRFQIFGGAERKPQNWMKHAPRD